MRETGGQLKRAWDNNWFILKHAIRYAPFFVFMDCLTTVLRQVVIFFEFTIGIKYITDCIQYDRPFSSVIYYIAFIAIFKFFFTVLNSIHTQSVQLKGKEKLYKKFRMKLFAQAVQLDLAYYDDPDYYNEFVWSINEVSSRIDKTMEYVRNLCGSITVLLTTGGIFLVLDKTGLIFIVVSVGSMMAVNRVVNKLRYRMDIVLNVKDRKRKYLNRVFYLADYAKELRINNVTDKLVREFKQTNGEMKQTIEAFSKKLFVLSFIRDYLCNDFILDGLYVIYIVFMITVKQAFSYGSAITLLNSSWRLKGELQQLSMLVSNFQENSLYIEKVRKFLEYKSSIREKQDALPVPKQSAGLELRNVSFGYDDKKGYILKNISMQIKPNEKIAVVGYNGSGKTTLMKLIMRLYDVKEGEILLHRKNIKEYRLEEYRQSIGTVFQDYQLFAATIAENVVMDHIKDKERERVLSALYSSGFQDRLGQLEHGIDTPFTKEFEDQGVDLSGGEAQKIAIARVFAKSCQYILLDEPSSALDPMSEYHMNQTMFEAAKNTTVIFISHRLSTTRMADRIYMMEKGEIIEQGTHEELMRLGGKYAEMFEMQAIRYRMVTGKETAS